MLREGKERGGEIGSFQIFPVLEGFILNKTWSSFSLQIFLVSVINLQANTIEDMTNYMIIESETIYSENE